VLRISTQRELADSGQWLVASGGSTADSAPKIVSAVGCTRALIWLAGTSQSTVCESLHLNLNALEAS
jgi:hypothetical protein